MKHPGLVRATLATFAVGLIGFFSFSQAAGAADMLFWTDLENGQLMSMPLDGSAAPSAVNTSPAVVSGQLQSLEPGSLDYSPQTGGLYWPNSGNPQNVSYAAADGSGGGVVSTVGSPVNPPYGLSLDEDNDKFFLVGGEGESVATLDLDGNQGTWALNDNNFRGGPLVDAQGGTLWLAGPELISYGNLDGTGTLKTYAPANFVNGGFSVDRDANRLYGTGYPGAGNPDVLTWISTDGSGEGTLTPTSVDVFGASSTAIDHDTGQIYWTNAYPYGEQTEQRGIYRMPLAGGAGEQVGSSSIGGRSGGLLILKAPLSSGHPELTGGATTGSTLTCGDATWAGDRPEAHYFRSPVTESVTWFRNLDPIPGEDGDTLVADQPGTYECVRGAENPAGQAFVASNGVEITTPVCPAIQLGIKVSGFTPGRPFGNRNAPGVRVTFRSPLELVVSLQPKITFFGKEGKRVGKLREHQIKVPGRHRSRFLLPGSIVKAIASDRGDVQFAPVTFSAKATVWQPGNKACAQIRNLKLKTRVTYVSARPGIGLRRR